MSHLEPHPLLPLPWCLYAAVGVTLVTLFLSFSVEMVAIVEAWQPVPTYLDLNNGINHCLGLMLKI